VRLALHDVVGNEVKTSPRRWSNTITYARVLLTLVVLQCGDDTSAKDGGVDGGDGSADGGACQGSPTSCYGSCNIDDLRQGECVDGGWVCNDQCPCISKQGRPPELCYSCADGGLGPQEVCNLMTDMFSCPDGGVANEGACPPGDAASE
jgi:hypothetical protein